jgi:hypothetical protein
VKLRIAILAACVGTLALAVSTGAFAKEVKNNTKTGSKTPQVHINQDGLGQALVYPYKNKSNLPAKKSSLINVNEGTDFSYDRLNNGKTGASRVKAH